MPKKKFGFKKSATSAPKKEATVSTITTVAKYVNFHTRIDFKVLSQQLFQMMMNSPFQIKKTLQSIFTKSRTMHYVYSTLKTAQLSVVPYQDPYSLTNAKIAFLY